MIQSDLILTSISNNNLVVPFHWAFLWKITIRPVALASSILVSNVSAEWRREKTSEREIDRASEWDSSLRQMENWLWVRSICASMRNLRKLLTCNKFDAMNESDRVRGRERKIEHLCVTSSSLWPLDYTSTWSVLTWLQTSISK